MKAALMSLKSKSSLMTEEALKKYFKVVDHLDIRSIEVNLGSKGAEILHEGEPLKEYDCIYAKGSFKFAPLLSAITYVKERQCNMPLAANSFSIGHDKLLTQLCLQQNNVPMPKTYIAATIDAAKESLEKINYPIVMKFPQGTQGKGVMFADSFSSASSMLDALSALKQPFLIQEYIETEGTDIRAIVVGDKVVAAMKRVAEKGKKRANIHAGAEGEAYTLDNYSKKIAIKAAQVIGAEICGVDILEGPQGPLILEVNLSPGLQGITDATKVDVADKIASYLADKTYDFVKSQEKTGATKLLDELGIKDVTGSVKEVISNLDFRGQRILLPEVVSDVTKFDEKDEVSITAKPGEVKIKKFG